MKDDAQIPFLQTKSGRYAVMGLALGAGLIALAAARSNGDAPADPHELLPPMFAMFGLTALVWALMGSFRQAAVFMRKASPKYYGDFRSDPPPDWVERPARAFNNLMQAPMLLYVAAILMLITPWADRAQIHLAWLFVAVRALHAAVYIAYNYVPLRFAAYVASSLALGEMWLRLALHTGAP